MIPKIIHQTFETKFTPPGMSRARGSWSANNPEHVYKFYEATDRIDFIKNNFPVSVLKAYHDIIPGAFKADLFRYCVLYINGGIYIDIKYNTINDFKLKYLCNREHFVLDHCGKTS